MIIQIINTLISQLDALKNKFAEHKNKIKDENGGNSPDFLNNAERKFINYTIKAANEQFAALLDSDELRRSRTPRIFFQYVEKIKFELSEFIGDWNKKYPLEGHTIEKDFPELQDIDTTVNEILCAAEIVNDFSENLAQKTKQESSVFIGTFIETYFYIEGLKKAREQFIAERNMHMRIATDHTDMNYMDDSSFSASKDDFLEELKALEKAFSSIGEKSVIEWLTDYKKALDKVETQCEQMAVFWAEYDRAKPISEIRNLISFASVKKDYQNLINSVFSNNLIVWEAQIEKLTDTLEILHQKTTALAGYVEDYNQENSLPIEKYEDIYRKPAENIVTIQAKMRDIRNLTRIMLLVSEENFSDFSYEDSFLADNVERENKLYFRNEDIIKKLRALKGLYKDNNAGSYTTIVGAISELNQIKTRLIQEVIAALPEIYQVVEGLPSVDDYQQNIQGIVYKDEYQDYIGKEEEYIITKAFPKFVITKDDEKEKNPVDAQCSKVVSVIIRNQDKFGKIAFDKINETYHLVQDFREKSSLMFDVCLKEMTGRNSSYNVYDKYRRILSSFNPENAIEEANKLLEGLEETLFEIPVNKLIQDDFLQIFNLEISYYSVNNIAKIILNGAEEDVLNQVFEEIHAENSEITRLSFANYCLNKQREILENWLLNYRAVLEITLDKLSSIVNNWNIFVPATEENKHKIEDYLPVVAMREDLSRLSVLLNIEKLEFSLSSWHEKIRETDEVIEKLKAKPGITKFYADRKIKLMGMVEAYNIAYMKKLLMPKEQQQDLNVWLENLYSDIEQEVQHLTRDVDNIEEHTYRGSFMFYMVKENLSENLEKIKSMVEDNLRGIRRDIEKNKRFKARPSRDAFSTIEERFLEILADLTAAVNKISKNNSNVNEQVVDLIYSEVQAIQDCAENFLSVWNANLLPNDMEPRSLEDYFPEVISMVETAKVMKKIHNFSLVMTQKTNKSTPEIFKAISNAYVILQDLKHQPPVKLEIQSVHPATNEKTNLESISPSENAEEIAAEILEVQAQEVDSEEKHFRSTSNATVVGITGTTVESEVMDILNTIEDMLLNIGKTISAEDWHLAYGDAIHELIYQYQSTDNVDRLLTNFQQELYPFVIAESAFSTELAHAPLPEVSNETELAKNEVDAKNLLYVLQNINLGNANDFQWRAAEELVEIAVSDKTIVFCSKYSANIIEKLNLLKESFNQVNNSLNLENLTAVKNIQTELKALLKILDPSVGNKLMQNEGAKTQAGVQNDKPSAPLLKRAASMFRKA